MGERLRTLTNGCGGDEGTSGNHGSLLSRDTGDRGTLISSVKLKQKLRMVYTEALRVCVNMVTTVVVSIEGLRRSLMCSGLIFEVDFTSALNPIWD